MTHRTFRHRAARGFAAIALLLSCTLAGTAHAATGCKTYEQWMGGGKISIVDFRGSDPTSPFRFRLEVNALETAASDGYMGPITRGELTFSYPRQANPEVAYSKDAPYPAPYTRGPAFGEKVRFQAREIACNVFEVHWKEPHKGDTVTHVQDFGRRHVCTNITNINREPIPAAFDPLDLKKQLNDRTLFPAGSPLEKSSFGWYNLCGTLSQSLKSDRAWEKLGFLVYTAP